MTLLQTIRQFLSQPSHIPQNIIWRFPKTKSSQNHIFVVGAPRSGTTLVKLILGAHPNLISPGYETAIFMYNDIFSFKFGGFTQLEMDELRKDSQNIIQFFDKFAEKSLGKKDGKRFVEKTPMHVTRLAFLEQYFPNSQFINIFRDGRDCYCSARYHPNVVQASHVKRYARCWRKCINDRLNLGTNANIFDIKYEELVTDTERVVKNMMGFLQEDYNVKQLNPYYYSHHKIAQKKRQEFSKLSKPIESSSVNRYKKELTPHEIKQFYQIAGKQLAQLGYDQ